MKRTKKNILKRVKPVKDEKYKWTTIVTYRFRHKRMYLNYFSKNIFLETLNYMELLRKHLSVKHKVTDLPDDEELKDFAMNFERIVHLTAYTRLKPLFAYIMFRNFNFFKMYTYFDTKSIAELFCNLINPYYYKIELKKSA